MLGCFEQAFAADEGCAYGVLQRTRKRLMPAPYTTSSRAVSHCSQITTSRASTSPAIELGLKGLKQYASPSHPLLAISRCGCVAACVPLLRCCEAHACTSLFARFIRVDGHALLLIQERGSCAEYATDALRVGKTWDVCIPGAKSCDDRCAQSAALERRTLCLECAHLRSFSILWHAQSAAQEQRALNFFYMPWLAAWQALTETGRSGAVFWEIFVLTTDLTF